VPACAGSIAICMCTRVTTDRRGRSPPGPGTSLPSRKTPTASRAIHSPSCGHPGFVPDDYLDHLDGLRVETTITAAELCTCDMWERVDGSYRVLDWGSGRRTRGPWPGNANASPWFRPRWIGRWW
jgi:hypothetical protein